jgi:predicted DNA-binding ribbon-helix-helix protein
LTLIDPNEIVWLILVVSAGEAMTQGLISRNVTINGRRTSLRLEDEFWEAMAEACTNGKLTVHQLCSLIDGRRGISSRTSAIRAFMIAYFRAAATKDGHLKAGHGKLGVEISPAPKEKRTGSLSKLINAA